MSKKKKVRFFWETPFDFENLDNQIFGSIKNTLRSPFTTNQGSELAETEGELLFRMELPGFNKDEIDLDVTENSLSISAEKKEEKETKEENYFSKKTSHSAIAREFRLPKKVIPEKTEAKLENGVLTIKMWKLKEKNKKTKKVKIK